MKDQMSFMDLAGRTVEGKSSVPPVIKEIRHCAPGHDFKLDLIVLIASIVGAVAYSEIRVTQPRVLRAFEWKHDTRSEDAAVRDALNSKSSLPVQTPAIVNGYKGYYDARGNFFPTIPGPYQYDR